MAAVRLDWLLKYLSLMNFSNSVDFYQVPITSAKIRLSLIDTEVKSIVRNPKEVPEARTSSSLISQIGTWQSTNSPEHGFLSGQLTAISLGPTIQSPLGSKKTFKYHDIHICKFLKKHD